MFTAGMIKPANTTPITNIVDTMDLMVTHSLISIETIKRKNTPQIKASLDKNSSQRIRSFYVYDLYLNSCPFCTRIKGILAPKLYHEFQLKIALFCPT